MEGNFDNHYWNNRYLQKQTGWDIGYPSTPLKTYIDRLENKSQSILIPGCGNAYEAEYLLQQGFEHITLLDFAPDLTTSLEKKLQRYLNGPLQIITDDFFNFQGAFDLILEQTFLSALAPQRRTQYVQQMHALLKDEGKLAGVLFDKDFEGGPPFGGCREEYTVMFSPYFSILTMEPCTNSIPERRGTELFMELKKMTRKSNP